MSRHPAQCRQANGDSYLGDQLVPCLAGSKVVYMMKKGKWKHSS